MTSENIYIVTTIKQDQEVTKNFLYCSVSFCHRLFPLFRRYDKRFINVEGRDQVYTNWNSGEPNNSGGNENCALMYTNTAGWNDASCSSNHDFVCEIKL